jgi:predicted heme/steroid binding protein
MNNELFSIFQSERGDIYDEFKNTKYKVSITSDIWSAGKHNKSYCIVTAHWITDEINIGTWFLNKRLLALRVLDYPHVIF